MNFIKFAVRRPIAASMFLLMAVFLGYYFYLKVPATLLPEFDLNFLFVRTSYPGVSSEDMARMVTEPAEGFIELVHGLKEMRSTTREGESIFNLQFRDSVDIDLARIETFEKIEAAELPEEVETFVFQFDPTAIPVIALDCFGGSDKQEILDYARNVLKLRIERVPGVGKVEFKGDRETEIRISIAEEELKRFGLTISDVWRAIISENLSPVGGRIREGKNELLVRTVGRITKVEDFRLLPISRPGEKPILLGNIAYVTETFAPSVFRYRFNSQAAVMLEVSRKPSANTLELCREIKTVIQEAEKENKKGIRTDIYMDASEMIEKVLDGLKGDLLIGLVVAAIVLIVFLLNVRSSLIVLATVPVCIMATFVPMYFLDINLNLLSMMGFALVSGMLVDNAIIILENIVRYVNKGYSAIHASEVGAEEVRGAVMTSTFTSMAVFVPIFFLGGQTSQIFRDLAFTAIFAIGSSLIVAFLVVPMLASKLLSGTHEQILENRGAKMLTSGLGLNRFGSLSTRLFVFISNWSQSRWWKRLLLIIVVIVFLVGGKMLQPPRDNAEMNDPDRLLVRVNTGGGTSIVRADGVIRDIETYLRENYPRVEDISAWANKGGGGLYVELHPEARYREKYPDQPFLTVEELKEKLSRDYHYLPDVKLSFQNESSASPQQQSFEVRIVGRHFEKLGQLVEKTKKVLYQIDEIYNVETDFDLPGEEIQVIVDHQKAADLGISPQDIAILLRQNLSGGLALTVPRDGNKIDVRVARPESETLDIEAIKNIQMTTVNGEYIPLDELIDISMTRTTPPLRRESGEFYTTLKVLYKSDLSMEELKDKLVNDDKTGLLDRQVMPSGYRYVWGGVVQQMEEQQNEMIIFAVTAIGLVFLIMASQFESLMQPLIVMFTLPLAYVGAIVGTFLMGIDMNEMAIMGTIVLLGIVVNDAIVLVDYVNLLRKKGMDRKEAIEEAVKVRIKPIFMTTLTTVGALLPLLFGMEEGAEYRKPMGAVVASGLLFATVLTLLFIPAVYSIIEDIKDIFGILWLRIRISSKNIASKLFKRPRNI